MRYERVPYDTLYTKNSKKIVNPKHSNQNASIIRETDFYIKKLLNEGKPQQP